MCSSAVLATLPPPLKSSNWLFGSLYTEFKLLALTSNLHIILPPCSSHHLLLFSLLIPPFLPFSLSLAPGVLLSYALSQLQVPPSRDFLPFKPSSSPSLACSLHPTSGPSSFLKLLPSASSMQDCKLFEAGRFLTFFGKSCYKFLYICDRH